VLTLVGATLTVSLVEALRLTGRREVVFETALQPHDATPAETGGSSQSENEAESTPILGHPTFTNKIDTSNPLGSLAELGWGVKDAKDITTFEIANKALPDMKASAEYFTVLKKPFRLQFQQIPSISGVAFLAGIKRCKEISIAASDVTDLSDLKALKSLQILNISQTPFTVRSELDTSPLSSLTNLQTLGLNMSRVSDIEAVRRLTKLVSLNVGGSLVKDFSPVKDLHLLKSVDVRDSRVTDVSVLGEDNSLEELSVDAKRVGEQLMGVECPVWPFLVNLPT
jgi:Leucine-rich repeat (LRR) protein